MKRLSRSLRTQLILLTVVALLVLSGTLEVIRLVQQQSVLINSERRVGLTLIRSVNTTINSVRSFIQSLSDISELDTRLAELVQFNSNIDFIAITDADGLVIFHSSDAYRGSVVSELSQLPVEETIAKNVPGYGEVYLTSLSFDSSDLVDTPQYWIVIASAADPIQTQLTDTIWSSVLVTLLFTIIAAVLIIVFVQSYFVRPLEQLTHAANTIEAGDLTVQVAAKRNDEIGQMARSFNRMTQQLANSINTLEERVQERTAALEIARDQAEQASQAKSEFLSNMSHELRTPLNMVIGYTSSMLNMPQMYNNVPLPTIYRDDIQLIRESGKHLLVLINDILDLSKVEAGKLKLNFTAVDLKTTLDGVVAVSLGLIGDKPIQLRQHYPDSLPKIWADNVRVRQILLNLLSNAIKFTESGSVTLSAEVRSSEVYVAVIDTGPGIPESAISTIFDRFEQYQNHTDVQGTGLGLDISQRLAQLHGSHITIDSQVGIGSKFAFSLPIATEAQLEEKEETQLIASGNAEVFSGNADLQRIALVVATDTRTRQTLRRALESHNIAVVEANELNHIIELAMGLLPDCILLDASSQGIDQQHLLDDLQHNAETQSIPLILINDEGTASTPPQPQITPTIRKPIDVAQLIEAVRLTSQPETNEAS